MLSAGPSSIVIRPCFYRTSSIGDVILALGSLDLLAQLPVKSEVFWVGRPPTLEWIRTFFPDVTCFDADELDREDMSQPIWKEISRCHFAVDLQKNIRSVLFGRSLSKFRDVPIYTWQKDSWRRSRLVLSARLRGRSKPISRESLVAPIPQYHLMQEPLRRALASHLPSEIADDLGKLIGEPTVEVTDALLDSYPVVNEVKSGRWLALGVGGAHPTKQAPESVILDLLEQLERLNLAAQGDPSVKPLSLVFVGDENDRKRAAAILDKSVWAGSCLNLAGKLSLVETTLILSQCEHLVTNDSSLSHLAEITGTTVSVLFGPTIEGFGFAPRLKGSRAFSSELGCRPCSKHGKVECRYEDQRCFRDINIGELAEFVFESVNASESGS